MAGVTARGRYVMEAGNVIEPDRMEGQELDRRDPSSKGGLKVCESGKMGDQQWCGDKDDSPEYSQGNLNPC